MALSVDLRKRVVEAVVVGGQSRKAVARRLGVSISSAVRGVTRHNTTGQIRLRRHGAIADPAGSRRSATICSA
jgi:transposase